MNSMYENCNLFRDLTRLRVFTNSIFFLIFTNDDILKNLLLKGDKGLIKCFGKNDGIWCKCLQNEIKKIENDNENSDTKYTQINWIRNILDNDDETWDEEFQTPNDFDNDNELNVLFEEYHRLVVEFIQNLFFRRYKDELHDQIITHVVDASQPRRVQNVFTQIENILLQDNVDQCRAQ